jgi:hypothetical protein
MPRYRPVDYRRLRDMVKPAVVLQGINWRATSARPGLARGPCPIHRSQSRRSRSFWVSDTHCYCYKCHFLGDAVGLKAALEGIPVLEAAHKLAIHLKLDMPYL